MAMQFALAPFPKEGRALPDSLASSEGEKLPDPAELALYRKAFYNRLR
jgi:hypothetical protein